MSKSVSVEVSPRVSDGRLVLFADLLTTHSQLTQILDMQLEEQADLSLTWFQALLALSQADGHALPMAELAAHVNLSAPGTTRLVDRLADAGLVERERRADDARIYVATLTNLGIEKLNAAIDLHIDGIDEHLMHRLSRSEKWLLDRVLAKLSGRTEEHKPSVLVEAARARREGRADT